MLFVGYHVVWWFAMLFVSFTMLVVAQSCLLVAMLFGCHMLFVG
jgi:hypothetical protein